LCPREDPAGDNPDIWAGFTYFGQFADHDITLDPVTMFQRQFDPNACHPSPSAAPRLRAPGGASYEKCKALFWHFGIVPGTEQSYAPRWVNLLIVGISAVVWGTLELFNSAWYGPPAGFALIIAGATALTLVPRAKRRYGNSPWR
jgi:hypothetical protein